MLPAFWAVRKMMAIDVQVVEARLDTTLLALAVLIISVAVYRRAFNRIEAKIGNAQVTLDAVEKRVNNVPVGTPTIPEQMNEILDRLNKIDTTLENHIPATVLIYHLDSLHRSIEALWAFVRGHHPESPEGGDDVEPGHGPVQPEGAAGAVPTDDGGQREPGALGGER